MSRRVELSEGEREDLACVETGHHPDHCDCNDAYLKMSDRFCEDAQEVFARVERIIAARMAQALEDAAEEFATGAWNDAWLVSGVVDDISAVQATEKWLCNRAAALRDEAGR